MNPYISSFVIPVLFALCLGIVHYYSDSIGNRIAHRKSRWLSFAAGVSIAYLFLMLLPELYKGVQHLSRLIFLYVLIGFIMFHLTEKYIYQHARRDQLIHELKEAHSITFFIYHLVIGIVAIRLIGLDPAAGILFLIPMALHTAIGNLSLQEIHKKVREKKIVKIFLSSSTLIGVLLAYYIPIKATIFYALLAFIIGAFLYVVIREEIPKDKKGNPASFIFGAAAYTAVIITVWIVTGF